MAKTIEIPPALAPYFEVCFILGFGICAGCGREQDFASAHPQFSDAYWLDEAGAMYNAGWIVPRPLDAYCPECAARRQSASATSDT
jgi:hypothetical protein